MGNISILDADRVEDRDPVRMDGFTELIRSVRPTRWFILAVWIVIVLGGIAITAYGQPLGWWQVGLAVVLIGSWIAVTVARDLPLARAKRMNAEAPAELE